MKELRRINMTFLICNIHIGNSTILESTIEQEVTKELAFNSKIITKLPNGQKNISFYFILVPLLEEPEEYTHDILLIRDKLYYKIHNANNTTVVDDKIIYSITKLFEPINTLVDLEKSDLSIDVITQIDDYSIIYTDGSFKKNTNEASYGIVKLKENLNGVLDPFSNKKYKYETMSEKIPNGTNNIGELFGLKTAINTFDSKKYQIIISDSEYSVKCFREWFYTWKDNNFRNYAKKPIANKDLIISIFESTKAFGDNHIIFFKWTRGHNKNPFNELCDELAKNILK